MAATVFQVILYIFCVIFPVFSLEKAVLYTQETFAIALPDNNHFIKFFAPWCGHCKRLAPTWEDIAEYYNSGEEVVIAKVDCTTETSLCSQQDVTGYPTLKFFRKGNADGVKYRGSRDLQSLKSYISEQLGKEDINEVKTGPVDIPEPIQGVYELTDDSFQEHIKTGYHFIKFYAPWCGHCQELAPTWEALGQSLSHDRNIKISKIDCTQHRGTCNLYEIKGYPTLVWFSSGKHIEKYTGARYHEDLKEFVNRLSGTSHQEHHKMADVNDGESPVVTLTSENFDNGISDGTTFVKFFVPWCGHCKRLAPTWDQLGSKFAGNPKVKLARVDCQAELNKKLCVTAGVEGFPTLNMYRNGHLVSEYTGARNLEELASFILQHISRDEL